MRNSYFLRPLPLTCLLLLICFLGNFLKSNAQSNEPHVRVSPYSIEIKQKDGTTIKIIGKGNQEISYTETLDGYTLLKNKQDIYEYAVKSRRGKLCPGGVKAKDSLLRTESEQEYLTKIQKNLRYSPTYLKKLEKKREKPIK